MERSSKQTILSGATLTLALVSDAVLYLLLPIYFNDFLLTLVWVGILLSANRFLRIILNPVITRSYATLGNRNALFLAVSLASMACGVFVWFSGPWVLLLARLMWGFSYGLMRLACLYSATLNPSKRLANMGWYAALQEMGPLLVLLIAPWINHLYSPRAIIGIALVFCLCAFIPILFLQQDKRSDIAKPSGYLPAFNHHHFTTFATSLLFDGVWVIVLAPAFIAQGMTKDQALAVVALLVIAKRSFNLIAGLLAVRMGSINHAQRWLSLCTLIMIVAAWSFGRSSLEFGSLLGIVGHGMFMILMPMVLADSQSNQQAQQRDLNDFTLWRDLASAFGALLGGVLLSYNLVSTFFLLSAVTLALALCSQWFMKSSNTQ